MSLPSTCCLLPRGCAGGSGTPGGAMSYFTLSYIHRATPGSTALVFKHVNIADVYVGEDEGSLSLVTEFPRRA